MDSAKNFSQQNLERPQKGSGTCAKIPHLHEFLFLVHSEEVGHLSRVQHAVDIFQEGLVLYLSVRQEKHCLLALSSGPAK